VHTWNAGEPEPGHGAVEGRFEVGDGTSALFALGAAHQEPLVLPSRDQVERRVDATASFWRSWAARRSYDGPWREAAASLVRRHAARRVAPMRS
jgi:hypothetical protein